MVDVDRGGAGNAKCVRRINTVGQETLDWGGSQVTMTAALAKHLYGRVIMPTSAEGESTSPSNGSATLPEHPLTREVITHVKGRRKMPSQNRAAPEAG